MRRLLRSLLLALPALAIGEVRSQDPSVAAILDQLRIDSMMHYVRQLSGEIPVDLGNGPEVIASRHRDAPGNDRAQLLIEQKFAQFGYTAEVQTFSGTGKNVFATKPGTIAGADPLIICAHYDAMPGGVYEAPGADDDGSGTAAVLEFARVLSDRAFEHPIIFALWDEEEQGLIGSEFYAAGIAANDVTLRAVINMDAIAYDGNGDTKARIHSRPIGNSHEIADSVMAMRDRYNIDLDLILTVPGAAYSDHASFWGEDYGAVLVIEEFGADGNPFYHTPDDKVEHFDVPYYEKLARLSLATLATLAVPAGETSIANSDRDLPALQLFPNPAHDHADLWITLERTERITISITDALGREVFRSATRMMAPGKHHFALPIDDLGAGNYSIIAAGGNGRSTVQLVKLP